MNAEQPQQPVAIDRTRGIDVVPGHLLPWSWNRSDGSESPLFISLIERIASSDGEVNRETSGMVMDIAQIEGRPFALNEWNPPHVRAKMSPFRSNSFGWES
jgi:hypothetical protein